MKPQEARQLTAQKRKKDEAENARRRKQEALNQKKHRERVRKHVREFLGSNQKLLEKIESYIRAAAGNGDSKTEYHWRRRSAREYYESSKVNFCANEEYLVEVETQIFQGIVKLLNKKGYVATFHPEVKEQGHKVWTTWRDSVFEETMSGYEFVVDREGRPPRVEVCW